MSEKCNIDEKVKLLLRIIYLNDVKKDGLRFKDIMHLVKKYPPSTLASLLKKLVIKGYLKREKINRKFSKYYLTERGEKLIKEESDYIILLSHLAFFIDKNGNSEETCLVHILSNREFDEYTAIAEISGMMKDIHIVDINLDRNVFLHQRKISIERPRHYKTRYIFKINPPVIREEEIILLWKEKYNNQYHMILEEIEEEVNNGKWFFDEKYEFVSFCPRLNCITRKVIISLALPVEYYELIKDTINIYVSYRQDPRKSDNKELSRVKEYNKLIYGTIYRTYDINMKSTKYKVIKLMICNPDKEKCYYIRWRPPPKRDYVRVFFKVRQNKENIK
ncbi:MAG: hypothetical protein LWW95_10790 [Candidatus Desulfofervidus auxilii]|nr:hypothetical protein [Candidatus Desulfofervidus auxilii]